MRTGGYLLCVAFLGGCTAQPPAKTVTVDGYTLAVSTDPHPPQVGMAADFKARLEKDNTPQANCQLRFRQYMHGMEMDIDRVWHTLAADAKSGEYRGRSAEFGMGGDWTLEFEFTCGGIRHVAPIPYHLAWPE